VLDVAAADEEAELDAEEEVGGGRRGVRCLLAVQLDLWAADMAVVMVRIAVVVTAVMM